MGILKDLKLIITLIVIILAIVGRGIWWEATVAKKDDLINSQIIQMEVNRILLLAPYGGKVDNAPSDIRAIHNMMDLESKRLRGG